MNTRALIKVDKTTFFDFLRRQPEGRFEYDRGRIVQQMTGGTLDHSRIVQRFISLIESQLNPARWLVSGHSRGVETPVTVRYPDVVVEPLGGAEAKGLATDCPLLVVEVLSPSTEDLDMNVKPAEYANLSSLMAYIVASQDEPLCWVWMRSADGRMPVTPIEIKGRKVIKVPGRVPINLSLSDVYRGHSKPTRR